ncbi:leucine dehydrogenase [Lentisalinibacter sediminis]|uniref:leucine dehydrogenase n=1 Tax=Lentisalinibacter sediminis TaxID=2992237 RepID=UPI003870C0B8
MELLDTMSDRGHEQVVFFQDRPTGLSPIVAIHSTVLGPALGGLRMWPYINEEEALFRMLGRFIGSLYNRYITAEDVGTTVDDMDHIFQETDRVVGGHEVHGGSGDPSPFTALGALKGIEACTERRFGHTDLGKLSFGVQGVGHVGRHLVHRLRERGARVTVTDINDERVQSVVEEYGAAAVPMQHIYEQEMDVFVPCALGGLIIVAIELQGYDKERAHRQVSLIYNNLGRIFDIAERDGIPSWQAADRMAEERIAAVGRTRLPYTRRFKDRLSGRAHHTTTTH